MAYRKLENVGEHIIEAVTKIGARDGIKECTAAKVAAECDVSDFTVLQYYGSKMGYLKATAESVSNKFATEMVRLIDEGNDAETIFRKMHDVFMASPESVLYYNRYRATINKGVLDSSRLDEWLALSKKLFGESENISDDVYLFVWHYAVTVGLTYAELTIMNPQFDIPLGLDYATQAAFKGINSFLK